ncbi:hypothetical protein [Streptomyces xanthii]|uniref:Uncharacterized protein n=1 Tax=Streptomyces xanthii TaxID=2768069 RepID=A0A7H1B208_9ACTN|nr:hypothetical protein [Streptomyces xanthii]QNS02763.1 hypothetical protein IAG42_03420 [Streptomyces xanthii]
MTDVPTVDSVRTSVYRVPTDHPEADGTRCAGVTVWARDQKRFHDVA